MGRNLFYAFAILLCSQFLPAQDSLRWYQASWQGAGRTLRGLTASPTHLEGQHLWVIGGAGAALTLAFSQDAAWQQALSTPQGAGADALAKYVAEPFGNPYYVGGALVASYALSLWGEHPQWHRVSEEALQSVATASLLTLLLKGAFHRVRPREQSVLDPYQFRGPSFERQNLSFPSGHATVAFALASSLSMHFKKEQWYWAIPLYGLAAATAWQRVYQQEHWPSDVLMGALIGTFIGVSNHYWQQGERLQWSAFGSRQGAGVALSLSLN